MLTEIEELAQEIVDYYRHYLGGIRGMAYEGYLLFLTFVQGGLEIQQLPIRASLVAEEIAYILEVEAEYAV